MKKYLILTTFLFGITLHAQDKDTIKSKFKLSGSYEGNGQWYTNDVNRGIQHNSIPLRSNNYLLLNLDYGKFTLGTQLESYANEALLNYNPKFSKTNFGTYYARYKSTKLEINLGHFYEQFGSGLALRSWEDRSLGINNALRGGRIIYKPFESIALTALYGKQRSGFGVTKGTTIGFNAEINVAQLFNFTSFELNYGFSYVNRNDKLPAGITNFSENTTVVSNRIGFEKNNFYVNIEHDLKSKDALLQGSNLNYNFVKPGNAFLVNLGYSQKGFGLDANLRRIENMFFLSERQLEVYSPENTSLNYNDKLMNYIPSLTKQHHSNLANIYVYQAQGKTAMQYDEQIQKFGEIGGQIDLFYEFKKGSELGGKYGTKLAINASSWYNLKATYAYYNSNGEYAPNYYTDILGSSQKYFSDYSIEITKKLSSKVKGNITYINQYYNDQYIRGIFQKSLVKSNILFAEATVVLPHAKSFTIAAEHMWADADRKNWLGGSVEYNHNEKWSFFATDMFNYGFDANAHLINATDLFDIHFYNFGTAYKKGSARIALNYGRQRGGLVCAGGVCRFVPPSTGLGIQISTTF